MLLLTEFLNKREWETINNARNKNQPQKTY